MSNLMNVNCLRPELRSRVLWLCRREDNKDRKLGDGEIDAAGEKSGGTSCGRQVWKIDRSADRARKMQGRETSQEGKEAQGDARCSTAARLSWPFLYHHLLLFKHILSFNA